ncbi:MAG: hypothetical protein QOH90_1763 [Actinomycetota bacterium]|nr:hypothetical protein [Actinomycetota bacterium]
MGVLLADVGIMRPATPPPEFNLEDAVSSINRIKELAPESLCLTHFGPADEGTNPQGVEETCDAAIDALHRWAEWVRAARRDSHDLEKIAENVQRQAEASMSVDVVSPEAITRMEQTTSYWMNTWGYMRYFDKLEKSA